MQPLGQPALPRHPCGRAVSTSARAPAQPHLRHATGQRLRQEAARGNEWRTFSSTEGSEAGPLDNKRGKTYHTFPRSEGLPLSLYTPYRDLPPDGKTLTEREETCNPQEAECKTPAHVYEAECAMCNGTGVVMSKIKGKKRPCTCMLCHGLGYVRRTTSRFIPSVNCVGPNLTINRPGLQNGAQRVRSQDTQDPKE